jgi:transketolase
MPFAGENTDQNQNDGALIKELEKQSIIARGAILRMTTLAGSGHPGGSMSTIDYLLALYSQIHHDAANPRLEARDRVVISHGHISPGVYSALALNDYFSLEQMISEFRLVGSIFEGHVEPYVPGVEWATGNLGQGLSAACGMALSSKLMGYGNQVYVLMGDGEQQKGQLSEARRFAVKFGLDNLTAFVDYNRLQISGACRKVMPQDIRSDYEAAGWKVIEIDGHDFAEILQTLRTRRQIKIPVLLLAHTVMGKGVSFMENDEKWHGQGLPYKSDDNKDLVTALAELGILDNIDELRKMRNQFTPGKCTAVEEPREDLLLIKGQHIHYEKKTDCRSAWGTALLDIARLNSNHRVLPLAVFDCDLSVSVKTREFAEQFPANFFQCGIMEHHTAVCAGAFSKQGFQTFFSDFGVFGIDETYNQHRLNDINETNLKVMLTHVGIDVGEDGKTHQCVDYLGAVRNLFNYRCIVPADANQTDHIIRWLSAKQGNYLVAMGRSKLDIIRSTDGTAYYGDDYEFEYGKADLLRNGYTGALFVMGTLTGRALQVADILRREGIKLQVWNISSPQQIASQVIKLAATTGNIFVYEDHNINTGLASCLQRELVKHSLAVNFRAFGVENYPVSGKSEDVYKFCNLDVETICERIRKALKDDLEEDADY